MKRRSFGLSICAGAFGCAFAPNSQASIRMAGRIIAVRGEGSAEVRRLGGDRMPARAGMLLYGGSSIVVTGEAEVRASVYGEPRVFKAGDTDYVVAERPLGPVDPDDERYFARFESFAAENPAAMPPYPMNREATKSDYLIKASPLLPSGSQLLLEGLKSAALVWNGGSGRLQIMPDFGEAFEDNSGSSAWLLVKVPPNASRIRIQFQDQPIQWTLIVADKATIERKAGGRPLRDGYVARLRWAHQTLLTPAPQYDELRLTALSIVAEAAQRRDMNSEFARLVWLAARNGRLESQFECTRTKSPNLC